MKTENPLVSIAVLLSLPETASQNECIARIKSLLKSEEAAKEHQKTEEEIGLLMKTCNFDRAAAIETIRLKREDPFAGTKSAAAQPT